MTFDLVDMIVTPLPLRHKSSHEWNFSPFLSIDKNSFCECIYDIYSFIEKVSLFFDDLYFIEMMINIFFSKRKNGQQNLCTHLPLDLVNANRWREWKWQRVTHQSALYFFYESDLQSPLELKWATQLCRNKFASLNLKKTCLYLVFHLLEFQLPFLSPLLGSFRWAKTMSGSAWDSNEPNWL